MKGLIIIVALFSFQLGYGQVTLDADGLGNTYELITSIFAPGHNPIEVPDCNHLEFGDHIDEVFDNELNTPVFRFHIHTTPDDDRCKNFDRQRNEIKTYDKSPDNLLGVEGEKIVYKWKFKLAAGFQSSPNFTHLHQLKSVGGPLESMPMYTLTTRKGNPDKLELRYAETDKQVTLTKTDLAPFVDTWLNVTETIVYGTSGRYEIVIRKESDESVLFEYANNSIINWRPEADFVRPKWGIYRSLDNAQDLRDEEVLFANFSIEEIDRLTALDERVKNEQAIIFSNPVTNTLYIKEIPQQVTLVKIFSIDGRAVKEEIIGSETTLNLSVSSLEKGIYILYFIGEQFKQSKLILLN